MGYLYYGNYALYYEIGRVELLRSLGLTYRSLELDHEILMPVTAMQTRYVRPALYDDLVEICTEVRRMPDLGIVFHYELFGSAGHLLNGASVRLCFVSRQSHERVPVPPVLITLLRPYFG